MQIWGIHDTDPSANFSNGGFQRIALTQKICELVLQDRWWDSGGIEVTIGKSRRGGIGAAGYGVHNRIFARGVRTQESGTDEVFT